MTTNRNDPDNLNFQQYNIFTRFGHLGFGSGSKDKPAFQHVINSTVRDTFVPILARSQFLIKSANRKKAIRIIQRNIRQSIFRPRIRRLTREQLIIRHQAWHRYIDARKSRNRRKKFKPIFRRKRRN